jgi:hypothetical protein
VTARGRAARAGAVAGWCLFATAMGILCWRLVGPRGASALDRIQLRGGYALAAVACFGGFYAAQAFGWVFLITTQGQPLARHAGVTLWLRSNVLRYLPGKLWSLGGRVAMAMRAGVHGGVAASSLVLEVVLSIVAMGILSLANASEWTRAWPAYCIAAPLIACVHPRVLDLLVRVASRVLRRDDSAHRVRLSPAVWARALAIYLGGGVLQGTGTMLTACAVFPIAWTDAPLVIGASATAWLLGALSPLSPAGIGVREGALAAILSVWLPPSIAVTVAVAARVTATAGELGCMLVALLSRTAAFARSKRACDEATR